VPSLLRSGFLFITTIAVAAATPTNLWKVDSKVWRSAQPSSADCAELEKCGIVEVLSLREWHDDAGAAKGTSLRLEHVPMNAGHIPHADLVRAVGVLKDAPGPVLVHCWHGSDRTGTVVALYRMAVQGWPKDQAIAEFTDPRFGYHSKTYPNLRRYLETVDVSAVRVALGVTPPKAITGGWAHRS